MKVLVVDCGGKVQVLRELLNRASRLCSELSCNHRQGLGDIHDTDSALFLSFSSIELIVVPHNYDVVVNPAGLIFHALMVSNGPGDPSRCESVIRTLSHVMAMRPPIPVLGICLGW